ncbi:MAG: N-formylglutamate amidohydrolase [Alphaproteobacteria bacterium]|nr:N-formylglutamate amidohydrolase [Alphaproteobacteria bacterium]
MHVPGVFTRHDPTGTPAPVLLDSPHSGVVYPEDFQPIAPMEMLKTGEDAFVHELFGTGPEKGAILIEAHFPRVYIDPNRAATDIDPDLLSETWPEPLNPTEKSRLGLGLIRRLAVPGVPVHGKRLTVAEVKSRIDRFYAPYHAAIGGAYAELHQRFGKVWHINCHSMKSVANAMSTDVGARRPDFVLGDRDGKTCDPAFMKLVHDVLVGLGYSVAINNPYKGLELIMRYSDRDAGRHALQIEVNRGLYMDEVQITRRPGFEKLRQDLGTLLDAVVDFARKR